MKQMILILTLMSCLSFNYAQNIINEQFVSESDHFSGGRIFNVDNKLFVVMTFNSRGEDSIDGYKHQFIIKQYDYLKNKFELVFNSKNEYYHSYLSDIIVFQNHFIIKTSSQSENVKSKILAIDLNGKIKSEKPVSSFGGLLSNINGEKYFYLWMRQK